MLPTPPLYSAISMNWIKSMLPRKKKRNHNPRLVKGRRAYSFAEIARLFGVHIRTVQSWAKQGMEVACSEKRPLLVMGNEIRRFLKDSAKKRKQPLGPDEFYCPRCRKPRKSRPEELSVQLTTRKLGASFHQVIIKGVCEVCGQAVIRFSSDGKIKEFTASENMVSTEPHKGLEGCEPASVNTDIRKEHAQ